MKTFRFMASDIPTANVPQGSTAEAFLFPERIRLMHQALRYMECGISTRDDHQRHERRRSMDINILLSSRVQALVVLKVLRTPHVDHPDSFMRAVLRAFAKATSRTQWTPTLCPCVVSRFQINCNER